MPPAQAYTRCENEEDAKESRAADRRARFLEALKAAEQAQEATTFLVKDKNVVDKEESVRRAREEIQRQFCRSPDMVHKKKLSKTLSTNIEKEATQCTREYIIPSSLRKPVNTLPWLAADGSSASGRSNTRNVDMVGAEGLGTPSVPSPSPDSSPAASSSAVNLAAPMITASIGRQCSFEDFLQVDDHASLQSRDQRGENQLGKAELTNLGSWISSLVAETYASYAATSTQQLSVEHDSHAENAYPYQAMKGEKEKDSSGRVQVEMPGRSRNGASTAGEAIKNQSGSVSTASDCPSADFMTCPGPHGMEHSSLRWPNQGSQSHGEIEDRGPNGASNKSGHPPRPGSHSKLSILGSPCSSSTSTRMTEPPPGPDVRLDAWWEQTINPPKYIFKMRRQREAEMQRHRVMLADYRKLDTQLAAEYARLLVAVKSEENALDRCNKSLARGQQQVNRNIQVTIEAKQEGQARQDKWEQTDTQRRVEECMAIIQAAANENASVMQESMRAVHNQHMLNEQVKDKLQGARIDLEQLVDNLTAIHDRIISNPHQEHKYEHREPQKMHRTPILSNPLCGPVPYTPHLMLSASEQVEPANYRGHAGANEQRVATNGGRNIIEGGIGMLLRIDANAHCIIDDLVKGGPAHACGKMKQEDRILFVNGIPVTGLSLEQVSSLFVGPVGSPVFVAVDNKSMVRTVEVMRARVEVPQEVASLPSSPWDQHHTHAETVPSMNRSSLPLRKGASVREIRDYLFGIEGNESSELSKAPLSCHTIPFSDRIQHNLNLENRLNSFSPLFRNQNCPSDRIQHPSCSPTYPQRRVSEDFPRTGSTACPRLRIALLTHGWLHDIEPFVLLANAMVELGHTVYVAAPERYLTRFQQAMADWFIPLEHDPHFLASGSERSKLEKALADGNSEELQLLTHSLPNPSSAANAAAIWHACTGNRSFCASLSERAQREASEMADGQRLPVVDCLVFHASLTSISLSVSEVLGIPLIGVFVSGEILPTLKPVDSDLMKSSTSEDHLDLFPRMSQKETLREKLRESARPADQAKLVLPQSVTPPPHSHKTREQEIAVNAALSASDSWRLASERETVRAVLFVRREMGLPLGVDKVTGHCVCPVQPVAWLLAASDLLPPPRTLSVAGCNNILEQSIVTGAWLPPPPPPSPSSSHPSPSSSHPLNGLSSAVEEEVEAFLSAGAPPVYVSFAGVVVVTRKMLKNVITALVTLELRAVVDGDLQGMEEEVNAKTCVLIVHNLPLACILPRCQVIIHHGLPGTFHAALAAGCPSVVVPIYGDGMYWARAAAAFGIGPLTPVSLQHITPELLVQMLTEVRTAEVIGRAKSLSEREQSVMNEGEVGGSRGRGSGVACAVAAIENIMRSRSRSAHVY